MVIDSLIAVRDGDHLSTSAVLRGLLRELRRSARLLLGKPRRGAHRLFGDLGSPFRSLFRRPLSILPLLRLEVQERLLHAPLLGLGCFHRLALRLLRVLGDLGLSLQLRLLGVLGGLSCGALRLLGRLYLRLFLTDKRLELDAVQVQRESVCAKKGGELLVKFYDKLLLLRRCACRRALSLLSSLGLLLLGELGSLVRRLRGVLGSLGLRLLGKLGCLDRSA